MSVKARIELEKKIYTHLIDELLSHALMLNVDCCDEGEMMLDAPTTDREAILAQMFQGDDDRLYVYRDGKPLDGGGIDEPEQMGWVFLVYGNDGYDVISDYTTNLEDYIAKTNALAETYA